MERKGESFTVSPIRDLKSVQKIRRNLLRRGELRNALIFCMGTNSGLRGSDLLNLKVGDVKYLEMGVAKEIKEIKTGKKNVIVLNKTCFRILHDYLQKNPELCDSDYLFPSRKGRGRLDTRSLNRLVKQWTSEIGMKGERYGSHTLRKTFGYLQRTNYGVGFEILAKRFNHSNPAITMRYLGIEDKEVVSMMMNEI